MMINNAFRKLNDRGAESITETLTAVLVMSLVITVLSGSVVTAARINKKTDSITTSAVLSDETGTDSHVIIYSAKAQSGTGADQNITYVVDSLKDSEKKTVNVKLYTEEHDNGNNTDKFCYYRVTGMSD